MAMATGLFPKEWADYFPAPLGQKWNSWLPSRHSAPDFLRVIDYCTEAASCRPAADTEAASCRPAADMEHYFSQPNYWTVESRLFFSLFEPVRFVEELGGVARTRELLNVVDERLERSGFPSLHLNAMVWDASPVAMLRDAGFRSTTNYNTEVASCRPATDITSTGRVSAGLIERYEDLVTAHPIKWRQYAETPLPYLPVVTIGCRQGVATPCLGWDVTPRCEKDMPRRRLPAVQPPTWPFPSAPGSATHAYPYGPVVIGNTPELFGQLCHMARQHIRQTCPGLNAVFINAWNEWTEGCYLLPEKRYGLAYTEAASSRPAADLQAVREAFG